MDANGTLYVTDYWDHLLRTISPTGSVNTLAQGFYNPYGVILDSASNIYVADQGNHVIKTVNSRTGAVSVLAGDSGSSGFLNEQGTSARFSFPSGIVMDVFGNIVLAEMGNHLIRLISPNGTVTTLAGNQGVSGHYDGPASAATFSSPTCVAVDRTTGAVYVGDYGNHLIRKIFAGSVTTLAGSGSAAFSDGLGTSASFWAIRGMTTDATGNIFVCDEENGRVRVVTPQGNVTSLVGGNPAWHDVYGGTAGYSEGVGTIAAFNHPFGVVLDPTGNTAFVADYNNHRIRKVTIASKSNAR
jgi:sugar lactone lactonase YvrE